jgi:hypothetical protein
VLEDRWRIAEGRISLPWPQQPSRAPCAARLLPPSAGVDSRVSSSARELGRWARPDQDASLVGNRGTRLLGRCRRQSEDRSRARRCREAGSCAVRQVDRCRWGSSPGTAWDPVPGRPRIAASVLALGLPGLACAADEHQGKGGAARRAGLDPWELGWRNGELMVQGIEGLAEGVDPSLILLVLLVDGLVTLGAWHGAEDGSQ